MIVTVEKFNIYAVKYNSSVGKHYAIKNGNIQGVLAKYSKWRDENPL